MGKNNWRKLENAAKIFPATSGKVDERVFRYACELNEEVMKEQLQEALNATIKMFPMYQCVLRKGFFWYYLEDRDIDPIVEEETNGPCSRIYEHDQKNLLFRVSYFRKRINYEVFHALTDASGAMQFLKTLVYAYLNIVHPDVIKGPLYSYDATKVDKEEDSFDKYYTKVDKSIKIPSYNSYQIRGRKLPKMQIIEGRTSVSALLKIAKEHHTTLTVLLTAIYLVSIQKEFTPNQKNKTAALMIPVNMRAFNHSNSARNYFSWINVGYDFENSSKELTDVIAYVSEFFKREITTERMAVRNNSLVQLERNVLAKLLPLEIKSLGMRIAAGTSTAGVTAIFSNPGKIDMPNECIPYIKLFNAFITTKKMQLCTCSFQDNLVLSFTSLFENTNVIRNFFREITALGIEVEISANLYE